MRCAIDTPSTVFLVIALSLGVVHCSGSGLQHRQLPEDQYAQTLNFQFQAQIFEDGEGRCKSFSVRVRPVNKLYLRDAPPDRLQIFDDDCLSPVLFERVQYVSDGGVVLLSGSEVSRFMSTHFRLESELVGWLWQEGIL